jgi:tRNA threonylcarbamoyladenosine biosynthesis protein TsaB
MKPLQWLAFDTSTEVLSIGLTANGRTDVRTLAGGAQASASLIPNAMEMLAQAGIGLPQLDAIVFGRGPGSFTGLRTACAVAQGLAFGASLPVLPVDTLLAVAEEARVLGGVTEQPLTVLALLDARMDEVYSAAYDWDGQCWTPRQPLQVGPPQHTLLPDAPRVLLAGNAFEAYGQRLPVGERVHALPTAAALLRLAPGLFAQGQAVPAEQAMPLYIRDKVAQTTAEREAARSAT